MAPLSVSNTARFWLDYNNGEDNHTIMWRYVAEGGDPTAVMENMHAFLLAFEPAMATISVTGARYANFGTNVSIVTGWSGDASYGSGVLNPGARAVAYQFLGRSFNGRRSSFYLFAAAQTLTANQRFTPITDDPYDEALIQLQLASDALAWVSISGTSMVVKRYVNQVVNDYWTHQMRGG